ncbi:MAG TPA: spherulation-specific family 4 protein [Gemmatimonadales bacterium]
MATGTSAVAQTPSPQAIAVPAFFPVTQNHNGVTPDWQRILNAGEVAKVVVAGLDTLGAGTGGTDCLGSPAQMFDCLRANGQFVLGYVDTGGGARDASCPTNNPNCNVIHGADGGFSVDQWYTQFGSHIDGIFFDNGPTATPTAAQRTYYENLYAAVRSSFGGRCGTGAQACVMVNASQVAPDWVINGPAADWAVTYERPIHGTDNNGACGSPDQQDYFGVTPTASIGFCPNPSSGSCQDTMSPANWYFAAGNSVKTAHVLRKPSQFGTLSNADLDAIIAKGRNDYGYPGFLYVHDQGCSTNGAQYSYLSPYFEYIAGSFGSALTVNKAGTGSGTVTSSPAGISCGTGCSTQTNHLSTHLAVTLTASAASGSSFAGFTVNGTNCSSPCSFTLTGSTTVAATFNGTPPPATLTVNKTGGSETVTSNDGRINCGATCSAVYTTAATVTLSVLNDGGAGVTFVGWSGAGCSGTGTCTVTMNTSQTVTAVFSTSGNPLVETLTDPFSGPQIDSTRWSVSTTAGTAGASGGTLTLTPNSLDPTAGIFVTSVGSYTLVNSRAHVKVASVVDHGGNVNNRFRLRTSAPGNELGWWYEQGSLIAYYTFNGTDTAVASFTYSAATDVYWQLRQTNGVTYWETSPDGAVYSPRATLNSLPFAVNAVQVQFSVRAFGTGAANSTPAKYTNLNGAALPKVHSLADPFTQLSSATWAVSATAGTAGASSGVLTLTPNAQNASAAIFVTSNQAFTFVESTASVRVAGVVDSGGNINNRFRLRTSAAGNELGWWYEHGSLFGYYTVNGTNTAVVTLTYAPATHVYWRLRQAAGVTYWETSADGVNYTIQGSSTAIPFALDAVQVQFSVKAFGTGAATATPAKYANLNQ